MIVAALVAIAGLAIPPSLLRRRLAAATAVAAITACLAAPLAYSLETISTRAHGLGALGGAERRWRQRVRRRRRRSRWRPVSPAVAARRRAGASTGAAARAGAGAGAGGGAAARRGRRGASTVSSALVAALKSGASRYRWVAATSGSQSAASLELAAGGDPVMAIGGFSGEGGNVSLAQFEKYVKAGEIHYYIAGGGGGGAGGFGGPTSTAGGAATASSGESSISSLFGGSSSKSTEGLPGGAPSGAGEGFPGAGSGKAGARGGSFGARGGSFGGGAGGTGGPGGRSGTTQEIASWVEAHYKAVTIGGQTVYDLTQPKS